MSSSCSKIRCVITLSLGTFALLAAPVAALEPSTRIVVSNPSTCKTGDAHGDLQHALDVELSSDPIAPGAPAGGVAPSPAQLLVSVECDRRGEAMTLRIKSSRSPEVAERSIDLADIPPVARPRLLALVIVETLHADPAARPAPPDANADVNAAAYADAYAEALPEPREDVAPQPPAFRHAARSQPRGDDGALSMRRDPYPGAFDEDLFSTDDPYRSPGSLELGLATQARLVTSPSALLLGVEANASGPLSERLHWGVEGSYTTADDTWTSDGSLDVRWASLAAGIDFSARPAPGLVVGPRLCLGYLHTTSRDTGAVDATLTSQLGARARFAFHVADDASLALMLAAQRTLGVLAIGPYSGLDTALQGWLVSWGVGVAFEP